MGPAPAVAAVRLAIRRCLADLPAGATVAVACSGGADSLALLAGTLFESRRPVRRVVGVTVDHGLQDGSAARAAAVADQMRSMGVTRAEVATVAVGTAGGPEAAARQARYAALDSVAAAVGASAVLLGHTRDDQAETVLLGLTRGSGSRSLSGMAPRTGRYRRPLLDLARTDTIAACRAESIDFWDDPHNDDPAYTRVRIRRRVLPVLEAEAGPGVAAALARTAGLLREDADALDAIAGEALAAARDAGGLRIDVLASLPSAVRRRVLRTAAVEAGCPPAELFQRHVVAVDTLVTGWRGQRGVDLPGRIRARRVRTDGGGMLQLADRPVAR